MTVRLRRLLGLLVILALPMLSGCATVDQKTKPIHPLFIDAAFTPGSVDKLVILPAVDLRKDRSTPLSTDELRAMPLMVYPTIFSSPKPMYLEWRGYTNVVLRDSDPNLVGISDDDLRDVKSDWIRKLGQDDDRWLLLLTLDDLASGSTFGAAVQARCSGYVFDKTSAKLIWKHRESAELGVGGLVGLIAKRDLEVDVTKRCAGNLINQLPFGGQS